EALGQASHEVGRADSRPLLGKDDEVGAGRRSARDETLGSLDVLRFRVAGAELHAGHTEPVRHGLRIAWEDACAPRRRSWPRRRRSPSSAPRRAPSARRTALCATCSSRATAPFPCAPTGEEVLGVPCVASLREIDEPIDLVGVFRRPEFCPQVAEDAVAAGAKALWLQLGIVSPEARRI